MKTIYKVIKLKTNKQFEVVDITEKVLEIVREINIVSGVVTIQSPHSTASIRINNFEPLLQQDMFKTMYRLAPLDISYSHDLFELKKNVSPTERSNGHAHVKAFILGSSESVIVDDSKLMLGANQSVLFIEFDGGRNRNVQVSVMGE